MPVTHAAKAEVRPRKAKGTVRPQQGLEHLCARLVEAGIVRPPRHLDRLHQGLIDAGAARMFGAPFDATECRPLREVDAVAERVRRLLGFDGPPAVERAAQPAPHPPRLAAADGPPTQRDEPDHVEHRIRAAQG